MSTREKVKALKEANPDMTGLEIADALGVTKQRVSQLLRQMGYLPKQEPTVMHGRDSPSRTRRFDVVSATSTGAHGEMLVCADLLGRGLDVFRSVSGNARCDVIASSRSTYRTVRIEVRCGYLQQNGKIVFNRSHDVKGCDLVAVVVHSGEIVYLPTGDLLDTINDPDGRKETEVDAYEQSGFIVLNHLGAIWGPTVYDSVEDARAYIQQYQRENPKLDMSRHMIVPGYSTTYAGNP